MAGISPPEAKKIADVSVVMVPLPAQGHLNQLLYFSRRLAALGLSVHYMSTAAHIRQVRERETAARHRHHGDAVDHLIQFHQHPLPSFSSPPPDPYSPTKCPTHLLPAFEAALHMEPHLDALVRSLASTCRRVVVVHDRAMPFATNVGASLPNVEAFYYNPISAMTTFCWLMEQRDESPEPVLADPNLPAVPRYTKLASEELSIFFRRQIQNSNLNADVGYILNTCHPLEGRFIDLLARQPGWRDKKVFVVGPLNYTVAMSEPEPDKIGDTRDKCLAWLDLQPPASVLYVSFGTTTALTDEQVVELAAGLEASQQRFIWVLRDADRADIYAPAPEDVGKARKDKLPLDYDRRIEGRGMVVRGWAPQAEILLHSSTGGFMSHCGWNSCLESLANGVPVIAWPMHTDQLRNAQLMIHVHRVGFPVRGVAEGDHYGFVGAAAIRDSVKRLMVEEEGEEARLRARKLGEEARRAVKDGGTSKADLDAFVAYIARSE